MSESGTENLEERITRPEQPDEQPDERLTRALELLVRLETASATKTRRNWDVYAAIIASLVGLLALGISGVPGRGSARRGMPSLSSP